MNKKSLWFSHVLYTGWKGIFKLFLCLLLTQLFLIPGILLGMTCSALFTNPYIGNAITVIILIINVPVGFYYASRILKIQT